MLLQCGSDFDEFVGALFERFFEERFRLIKVFELARSLNSRFMIVGSLWRGGATWAASVQTLSRKKAAQVACEPVSAPGANLARGDSMQADSLSSLTCTQVCQAAPPVSAELGSRLNVAAAAAAANRLEFAGERTNVDYLAKFDEPC